MKLVQYTFANRKGCSIKKNSVPISKFVRNSEIVHVYGNFAVTHFKI